MAIMEFELFTEEGSDILNVDVDYNFSPYDPGVHTYSNGDPGYPPSGGDLEDYTVKWRGVDITSVLNDYEHKEITTAIYKHFKTLDDENFNPPD